MDENRKMISIRIPPELLRRLDEWRDAQEIAPQRTAVILEALKRFLADQGKKGGKR